MTTPPLPKSIPPGYPARRLAAEAFRRVLAERRTSDEALQLSRIPRLDALMTPADPAFARAIVTVAFRRLGTIRGAIAARLNEGGLPDAGLLEAAIVTAAAQILFMDAPDHAAVDLAVDVMKSDPKAMHFAGLGNAVLRRIAAEKADILALASSEADTPAWLIERWARFYGPDQARAIAARHGMPPHIDLTLFATEESVSHQIVGRVLPGGSLRLAGDEAISMLPGFAEGAFQVQDVAASFPARLVDARAGMRILDLCAAPGGKTVQLAATGALVTAVERSADRAKRLTENLVRLRLSADLVIADVLDFKGDQADGVLIDAPCSATGTIRRHPEIAWSKTLRDVLALAARQATMLDHAASLVRPGGRLVFATCSLEREEGEAQIETFLTRRPDFRLLPLAPGDYGIPADCITSEGYFRALPAHFAEYGGADGFFAARLQRIA